ncbi:zinc finger CCCH domain-containing protein 2-like [Silene latifolia]|uniref:zinc finger CCCH domain-containing protein 2-like n=1 Tax=Silene latifolia TaxID=37657 RepID=UPI003D782169
MSSVCAEHHHHHHNHLKCYNLMSPKKNMMQELNIPPRKLLSRRVSDVESYFPDSSVLQKFLPCNGDGSGSGSDDGFDPDSDPYSSDQFRMYEFKVRKCTRSRSHDWTDCPFAHPGEKARRRDPRRFHYSGSVCPEYRRSGGCSKGDECEFAHGVFECWLHPARYRTEACKDGKNCKRKVCFFAHTPRELRVLPAHEEGEELLAKDLDQDLNLDFDNNSLGKHQHQHHQHQHNCCKYCCALSPTSTLMGMSHFSPPMSPMKAVGGRGLSLSRYAERGEEAAFMMSNNKGVTYEDVLIAELLGSMDGMNLNEAVGSPSKGRGLWVDVGGYDNNNAINNYDYNNDNINQQMVQFSFSPSTPVNSPSTSRSFFSSNVASPGPGGPGPVSGNVAGVEESPDLGWVNDLLT